MELEDYLRKRIKEYDKKEEELKQDWESLHDLKPKDMNEHEFQKLIQKARYETKQENLDKEMIDNYNKNNPLKVKEYIHKGANKIKLYEYDREINKDSWKRTIIQQRLLEDLYNIKAEKNYPSKYDKEISDPKTITTEEFNKLYEKFKKGEEFTIEEENKFLVQNLSDGGTYTAVDNSFGNLFTEDFKDRNMALRYLSGESLDKLKDEECRYEVAIYETKEDYEQGEPFQENVYSSLEEAENSLNYLMKQNNYYSGFVLDQKTGIEECAYYSDEQQEEPEEEEM